MDFVFDQLSIIASLAEDRQIDDELFADIVLFFGICKKMNFEGKDEVQIIAEVIAKMKLNGIRQESFESILEYSKKIFCK
jgi:hypothetical protein